LNTKYANHKHYINIRHKIWHKVDTKFWFSKSFKNLALLRINEMTWIFFKKNFYFLLKMTSLGVTICGKSIAHIFEPWKCFPDPNSGYCVLKQNGQNSNFFPFSLQYNVLNRDQGSLFKVRKCAQLISHIKLLLERTFPKKK
jgi:hypothetical protein